MQAWLERLNGDPLPWLLDAGPEGDPAVRHLALRQLLGRPPAEPDVTAAREAAMRSHPIATILAAQDPQGWWIKPGSGYLPKYRSTVWSLTFLEQMGADGSDPRLRAACEYVLAHAQAASGAFGLRFDTSDKPPPPSYAILCLNGNLLRALIGFGWLEDERVQRSIAWQAAEVTGRGEIAYYKSSVPGPGFRCGANDGLPCGWGATKAVLGLAAIPAERRSPAVRDALAEGIEFLLSCDPATAEYPRGYGSARPNASWFKLGFPSAYVTDVLQVLEALCAAGAAGDPRLAHAVEWLLGKQDGQGRFVNQYAYEGKLICDIDRPGAPSRWVTLRACRVLKAVAEA